MEFLGRVFNLPLAWIRANTFFSQCLVFPSDALHPPAGVAKAQGFLPKPCETAWYHHNSGFEGIKQKVRILDRIVDFWNTCGRANLKYQLIGQGDNQLLQFTFRIEPGRTDQEAFDNVEDRIQQLKLRLDGVGAIEQKPLKIDETYH